MATEQTGLDEAKRPSTVDEYLAPLPKEQRAALETLRGVIQNAVPEAVEVISYQIPVYKYKGRPLVSFGAAKHHCAFYIMSPEVAKEHANELQAFDASGATVRFKADNPLPKELVTKLIDARIAEIEQMRTA
jgi:uncharacterized protein YdhG (YjbR/CyaY superfamily)